MKKGMEAPIITLNKFNTKGPLDYINTGLCKRSFDPSVVEDLINAEKSHLYNIQYQIYTALTDDIDQTILEKLCEEIKKNHPEINEFIFLDRKDIMEVIRLGMEHFECYYGRKPTGVVAHNPIGGI